MPRPLWAPWRLEYIEADEARHCIFCDPDESLVVHRGELAFVLMNRFPYTSGHLMVAPLRHEGQFAGLTDAEALEIHLLAAAAVAALEAEYGPQGLNLGWNLGRAAGAGIIDHLHLHRRSSRVPSAFAPTGQREPHGVEQAGESRERRPDLRGRRRQFVPRSAA